MVTTRPPKTIVKPTALGPVANTDTKLLIYGVLPPSSVGGMTLRLYSTLSYSPNRARDLCCALNGA